ncbi:MAG TPA: hypothetical protein VGC67_11320 [Cellulomonas sp.]
MIRTTAGPVPPDAIRGTVLAHEHLAIDLRRGSDTAATLGDEDLLVAELAAARREHGLALVVELTCRGMGGDPVRVDRIARAAGVHAVTSTGYYYQAFHPEDLAEREVADLAGSLVAEIRGDGGPGIRPGVLGEIGSHGPEPTPAERVSLLAAGHAAAATGLSVATHAHLGVGGMGQLELLASTGLPPDRVSVGHQDLCADGGQHRAIADAGGYVAFDTVGKESYQSDDVRLALLLDLLEAGHADRVLLSNDVSRDAYLRAHGGLGYAHVLGTFADRLRAAGVDEPTLRLLYHDNPLRFLAGGAGTGVDGADGTGPAARADEEDR